MFKRFVQSFSAACLLVSALFFVGCSSSSFLVIEDAPKGTKQTLGLRTAADLSALSPTSKVAWLEYCDKVVTKGNGTWLNTTDYVNCEPADHLQQIADKSTSTGYIAGVVAPVIQGAAIAYAGHEIGKGLGRSGSTTNNNNTGGNGNGNASTSQNQGQGQLQSSHSNSNAANLNSNHASGGNGFGGQANGGNVNTGAANGNGSIVQH